MGEDVPAATAASSGHIERRILLMRGQRVLLDGHLAELYGIGTKTLKRAVRRNQDRFPDDFMFILTPSEMNFLRYQIGTLRHGQHAKHASFAFTEQGVAMLSSVLNSPKAIRMNIEIMRVFVRLRGFLSAHTEITAKLKELESRIEHHDEEIRAIFEAITQLMEPSSDREGRPIGY